MNRDSLWQLVVPIALWLGHFLATYAAAAVWCARWAPPDGALGWMGWALAGITVVAAAGLALTSGLAVRRYREVPPDTPDADSDAARHRFLALATLALSLVGGLGVVYVALSIALVGECR